MAIELYPHNQETYEKMTKMFKTSNRVGAVQPTGTGKSFLMLKWIEDHPDDTFIVISPSLEIFLQLVGYARETDDEDLLKSVRMISYQTLIRMPDEEIASQHAEKIIVDEFHRAGAGLWGPALLKLLNANPQAKVFGTSATPVRYLDNGRDMAYELFDRNLAVEMTLGDAINRKILPTPKYLGVWFDFDGRLIQLESDISYIKDPKKRNEKVRQFRRMKQQLEDSFGAHKIFREHMPKNGKFIVFCRDREHLDEMTRKMHAWLSGVNLNLHWYVSISGNKDKDLQLEAFKDDQDAHAVKLLYTIDRFNEGLHVKGIDGVIMLRPTISPIIYLQQLGRALAAGGKSTIIFDFVNNFGNVKISFNGMESSNPLDEQISTSPFKTDIDAYSILGQAKAVASILEEMDESLSWSYEKQWAECFSLYQKFKREFGRDPKQNESYQGVNLGKWVQHQREAAKRGTLSEDRERKLSAVGFVFDLKEAAWQENYELYKEFKEKFGHEPKFNETYQGVDIGNWVSNQRQAFKKGILSEERKQKLLDVGFIFDPTEIAWTEKFELYKEFKTEFGREPRTGEIYQGVNLVNWVTGQRRAFKKGILSEEKLQALSAIGFVFDMKEAAWQETYELYVEFKAEFNREPNRNEVYQGVNLVNWIWNQRKDFRKGKLSEERKRKLLDVGFNFDTPEDVWQVKFNAYKEFKQTYDREPKAEESYDGINLGNWCNTQRRAFKDGKLSEEKIRKLLGAGFVFDVLKDSWQTQFVLYKDFVCKFNRRPGQKDIYQGFNLGSWCNMQRQAFKDGKLSEERKQKLLEAGFIFDPVDAAWEEKLELYKAFKSEFECEPCKEEKYQGIRLGGWCQAQRLAYNKGTLTEERKRKLLEAGFVFDTLEAAWQENFDLYKAFKAEFGRDPKFSEVYQGVKLGHWVSMQRQQYRKDKLPEHRKQKLLEAGFVF